MCLTLHSLLPALPFFGIAGLIVVLRFWLSEEATSFIRTMLNVGAAFTAILSSIFWVENGKLGLIVNATPQLSRLTALENLWAAQSAYVAALLFAPAYIVDSLGKRTKKKGLSGTQRVRLAYGLCQPPRPNWFGELLMKTEDDVEAIEVMKTMVQFLTAKS